jgi:hypothetical protein
MAHWDSGSFIGMVVGLIPVFLIPVFFFWLGYWYKSFGKEYSQSGRVEEMVSDTHVLVKIEKCEHIPISALSTTVGADGSLDFPCEMFNSREEMEAFEEWLSTPDEEPAATGTVLN